MYVTCQMCGRIYDDARRWTICPHPHIDGPPPHQEINEMEDQSPPTVNQTPQHPGSYPETERQTQQRLSAFVYHPPKGDQPGRYERIRELGSDLAAYMNGACPPSRELSLAMTKLEEAVMWANAAIARNE